MTAFCLPETCLDTADRQAAELQSRIASDWRIHTERQRAVLLELKQRIGAVNWREEGYPSLNNQRDMCRSGYEGP